MKRVLTSSLAHASGYEGTSLGNPFSAGRVGTKAVSFLFAGGSMEALHERLVASRCWGQIVGPHGSGKSTLLADLATSLSARISCQLARAARAESIQAIHDGVLLVDEYEQLSRWQRWRLKRRCQRLRCGLVVTCHEDVGLPTLHQTHTSLETFRRLVDQLTDGWPPLIEAADVRAAYQQNQPNLRNALFTLYDVYETRRVALRLSQG